MLIRMFVRRLHVSPEFRVRVVSRSMPRTAEDFQQALTPPNDLEGNLVRVAFIGDPNVGKSTIINKLLARDICTVSNKPHTTRNSNPVAITTNDLQMVLVDTPGAVHPFHARKHHLPSDMVRAPKKALDDEIDVLAAVIDCSDVHRREYLSLEMLRLLHKHRLDQRDGCSVLILNKVDKVDSKKDLLPCIDSLSKGVVGKQLVPRKELGRPVDLKSKIWKKEEQRLIRKQLMEKDFEEKGTGDEVSYKLEVSAENPDVGTYKEQYPPRFESWPHFERVFIISALREDGIEDLREFLTKRAQKGVWKYRKEFITKQSPVELTEEVIKSKLLDHLRDDIPYLLTTKVSSWSFDDAGSLHVHVNIQCKNNREIHATLGKEGGNIKKINEDARQQLCNVFGCEVALKLLVVKTKS